MSETGFMVGAEAFLDLGHKLDHISNKMDRNPVYKPIGNSIVLPVGGAATLSIPGFPGRGRIWNILKIGLFGPDAHTPILSAVTSPAIPATGVAQFNNNAQGVNVTVTGGTVTVIAVNGNATGLTSGTVFVPAAGTITLTYSVAPTWTWAGTTITAVADVYAGSAPDVSGPTLDNAIIGGVAIPSVTNITKHVDWCSTGEQIFAVITGGQSGQQISLVARVAEYPVSAVEAMSV